MFKKLRDEQRVSVLYITHDLATAYYVCDRIAIMFRGNIISSGDVEKVLIDPKHPYVQLLRESIHETDLSKRWKSKIKIPENDSEEYLRVGCKFAGRCPQVMDVCRRVVPPDIEVDGTLVKCHLYNSQS